MKTTNLLSLIFIFVFTLIAMRLVGLKLQQYVRVKFYKKRALEVENLKIQQDKELTKYKEELNKLLKDSDNVVLQGSLSKEELSNIKTNGNKIFRDKKGRFVSKNQLENV